MVRIDDSTFPDLDGLFLFGGVTRELLLGQDVVTGETFVLLEEAGLVRDVDQLPSGDIVFAVAAPPGEPNAGGIVRLSPAQ